MRRPFLLEKSVEINCLYKIGSMTASLSLMITALNVNTTCMWIAHQDELPKSAEKLRNF